MHYIIGTTIMIPETITQSSQSSGVIDVTDIAARKPRRVKNVSPFQTGISYVLGSIRKRDDVFKYAFSSQVGNVEIEFDSPRQADQYIAGLKNESIPDYEEWHRDSS